MIAMLFIIVALVFDSHTLFVRTLPSDMGEVTKEITAWGMAIAFELTVLLATANSNYVHKSIQYFLAFCTLMTTLFFFDVFGEADTAKVFRIVFVSIMIACINFIYAELFVKKWQEYLDRISAGDELAKSFTELKSQLLEAENNCITLQESKIIVERNLIKHQQLVSELESQVLINDQKIKVNEQVNQTLQSELNILKSKLSRKREKSTAINNG